MVATKEVLIKKLAKHADKKPIKEHKNWSNLIRSTSELIKYLIATKS